MSIITVLAIGLAFVLVWKIGAPVARVGGAVIVIGSLVAIACGDSIIARTPLLLAGVVLWLLGHFATAYKRKRWQSRLAKGIVTHTPLRYVDPVDGHVRRQARRDATPATEPRHSNQVDRQEDDFDAWERECAEFPRRNRKPDSNGNTRSARRPNIRRERAMKTAIRVLTRVMPGPRALKFAWRLIR